MKIILIDGNIGKVVQLFKFLILIALAYFTTAFADAATYYVSVNGSDSNSGTSVSQPFATWQRAFDLVNPGDVVEISSGTYNISAYANFGTRLKRNGTAQSPITIRGTGATLPILDCSGLTYSASVYCIFIDGDYLNIENIAVRRALQGSATTYPAGIHMQNANNITLDNVRSYENQGTGIRVTRNAFNITIKNSDSYNNYDPLTGGGNADGFVASFLPSTSTGISFINSRSYGNSDDGFDFWMSNAPLVVKNNYAFKNGYIPNTSTAAGNGNGFKLGMNTQSPKHQIINNVSFSNRKRGFDSNNASGPMDILNNTAWENGVPYRFEESVANVLKNNISFGGGVSINNAVNDTYNSWNLGTTINSADFITTSDSCVTASRLSDGSLPSCDFLKLASTSDAIDSGINVGLPFTGSAPDLGAFEYTSVAAVSPTINPDLAVTSLSYNNTSKTFSATVINQSSASIPTNSKISIKYYVDDVYVASASSGIILSSGQTTTVASNQYTISSGAHTIKAVVNPDSTITESNKSNNQLTTSITIPTQNTTVGTDGVTSVTSKSNVIFSDSFTSYNSSWFASGGVDRQFVLKGNTLARFTKVAYLAKTLKIPLRDPAVKGIRISFKMGASSLEGTDSFSALTWDGSKMTKLVNINSTNIINNDIKQYSFFVPMKDIVDKQKFAIVYFLKGDNSNDYGYIDDVNVSLVK